MASAHFRDKLMARLILEEVINKTLVDSPGGITPLSELTVAGFDQDIYVKDLLEDYGWLGSWMHLSELYHAVSPDSGRIFKEEYAPSKDWLGGIKPLVTTVEDSPSPRVLDGSDSNTPSEGMSHMSFSKTQLLLRMAMLQTISINKESKVEVSMPSFQANLLKKTLSSGKDTPLSVSHKDAVSELFFNKIRTEVLPTLSLQQVSEPVKES